MTLAERLHRLRNEAEMVPEDDHLNELLTDFIDASGKAADEIDRLTAENERLREEQRKLRETCRSGQIAVRYAMSLVELQGANRERRLNDALMEAWIAMETNNDAG